MRGWALVDRFVPDGPRREGLVFWRERLLAALLLVAAVLGTIAYLPSALLALTYGAHDILIVDTVAYATAVVLLFGRRIPYAWRSTVILIVFWVLSGTLLLELGPFSAGALWLLASIIFTAVLATLPLTILAFVLSLLFFVVVDQLILRGLVPWAETVPNLRALWAVVSVNLLLLEAMLGLAVALVLRALDVEVAERKRLEEVGARSRELELENRRIVESSRLKDEFLANMSHELRTPLNAVIGFTELLQDGHVPPGSPQGKEFLGDILSSGRHLLQVIDEMLDLAKIDAGKIELAAAPLELPGVVNEVVGILRVLAEPKRIDVWSEIDPSLGEIELDPVRLKQVLYNYLSNAIKFTAEGGHIQVRIVPEGDDRLRLEVEDNGIGIAASDLPRLFIEFQQLDSPLRKRHPGTGLGLALTKRVVEAQGGTVGVRSTVGKGSVFHAVLPRRWRPG